MLVLTHERPVSVQHEVPDGREEHLDQEAVEAVDVEPQPHTHFGVWQGSGTGHPAEAGVFPTPCRAAVCTTPLRGSLGGSCQCLILCHSTWKLIYLRRLLRLACTPLQQLVRGSAPLLDLASRSVVPLVFLSPSAPLAALQDSLSSEPRRPQPPDRWLVTAGAAPASPQTQHKPAEETEWESQEMEGKSILSIVM